MRYAIVISRGRYGSGSRIAPATVLGDRERAVSRAARMGREFRRVMRAYGGTSGGFRVVEVDASVRSRCEVSWLGWELDLHPSVGADA